MRVLENARRPIGLHTVLSEGFRDVESTWTERSGHLRKRSSPFRWTGSNARCAPAGSVTAIG